jgi:hypothetical protein
VEHGRIGFHQLVVRDPTVQFLKRDGQLDAAEM